jgi:hypothetical protein
VSIGAPATAPGRSVAAQATTKARGTSMKGGASAIAPGAAVAADPAGMAPGQTSK